MNLNVELVEGHDGSKVKEGKVEVILEKLQDAVVSIFLLTVLQSETHTAHDGESTAAVEQKRTQLKTASHKPCLKDEPSQINIIINSSFLHFQSVRHIPARK